MPHEDALVLTLNICEFSVHKILVNLGSSIDLLQMLTYKKIGHSPIALEIPGCILIRFNRATTALLGNVILSIEVRPITLNVKFSMVADLFPYNDRSQSKIRVLQQLITSILFG